MMWERPVIDVTPAETTTELVHEQADRNGRVIRRESVTAHLPVGPDLLVLPADLHVADQMIVRRDAGLGDCIMALPALARVQDEYRHLRIDFWVPGAYRELLAPQVAAGSAHSLDRPPPAVGSRTVWVDLSSYVERHREAWRTDRVILFHRAFGVSAAGGPRVHLLGPWRDAAERWARARKVDAARARVGIAYRGAHSHRSWPVRHVRELSERLCGLGHDVVVFDRDAATEGTIREWATDARSNSGTLAPACGLPLTTVAAIVETCACVVGPDTGILHMAGALQRPLIGAFGAVDPALRLRWYRDYEYFFLRDALPCVPCCEGPAHRACEHECMTEISPEMVLAALTTRWLSA